MKKKNEGFNYQAQLYPWTTSEACYPCCSCKCALPGTFDPARWLKWNTKRCSGLNCSYL